MFVILAALSIAFGFVVAIVWTQLRKERLTMKAVVIPMSICLGLTTLLIAVAPAPPAREQAPSTTTQVTAAPSVSLGALNTSLASKPMQRKWSRVEFVNADRDKYRLYLTYGVPPGSMSEVKSDTIAVAKLALDAIAENGIDPWQGGTFVSVYAQRPEGSAGGKDLIRRYGNAHFSALTGKFEFEPAE